MKLNNDSTAETIWEDENGAEWDIKIHFDFQSSENAEYEEGLCVYPGADEGVTIQALERREYTLESMGTVTEWMEWDDATDKEEKDWKCEILEAIHTRAHDDRGNEA